MRLPVAAKIALHSAGANGRLRDRLRPVWFCARPKEVARVHDLRKDERIAASSGACEHEDCEQMVAERSSAAAPVWAARLDSDHV